MSDIKVKNFNFHRELEKVVAGIRKPNIPDLRGHWSRQKHRCQLDFWQKCGRHRHRKAVDQRHYRVQQ